MCQDITWAILLIIELVDNNYDINNVIIMVLCKLWLIIIFFILMCGSLIEKKKDLKDDMHYNICSTLKCCAGMWSNV